MSSRSAPLPTRASSGATFAPLVVLEEDESLESPSPVQTPNAAPTAPTAPTARSKSVLARFRATSTVARAAAKMMQSLDKQVDPPTWFEAPFFALWGHVYVAAALSAFVIVGGAGIVASMCITAACGLALSKPSAIAGAGAAFFWVASACNIFAMRNVWQLGVAPQGATISKASLKHVHRLVVGFGVALSVCVVGDTVALIVALTMDPDLDGGIAGFKHFAHAHMHAHATEYLMPPPECTSIETRDALSAWLLYGYVPARFVMGVHIPCFFACIVMACAFAADDIDTVKGDMGIRAASLNDDAWRSTVHDPTIALNGRTIRRLDTFGVPIGLIVSANIGLGFSQIPSAVATGNPLGLSHVIVAFAVPVILAAPVAGVGSSCDNLFEKLNELLSVIEGDNGNRRVIPLQRWLINLNRRQGLGVRIFSLVIDKHKLVQIASILISLGSSLAIALVDFGNEAKDSRRQQATESECSMEFNQRYQMWAAMDAIMMSSGGANATCSCKSTSNLLLLVRPERLLVKFRPFLRDCS